MDITDFPKAIELTNQIRVEFCCEAQFICAYNGKRDFAECVLVIEDKKTVEIYNLSAKIASYAEEKTTNEQFCIDISEYIMQECLVTNFAFRVVTNADNGATITCTGGNPHLL